VSGTEGGSCLIKLQTEAAFKRGETEEGGNTGAGVASRSDVAKWTTRGFCVVMEVVRDWVCSYGSNHVYACFSGGISSISSKELCWVDGRWRSGWK